MNRPTLDLGAQDPERKNSPIASEIDDDTETPREAMSEEPVCFFNDEAYAHGTVIKSGTALLRCDFGLWVPAGPSEPWNP